MKLETENILRLLLSGIFLWAGTAKLLAPVEFAAAVAGYRLTGPLLTPVVAATLPSMELLCAAALWMPRWRHAAVTVLLAACIAFLIALVRAWLRGLDIRCGCFGDHGGHAQYPYWIARDLVFLVTLTWLWGHQRNRAAALGGAERPLGWATGAAALTALGAALGIGTDAIHPRGVLWRELSERPSAMTAGTAPQPSEAHPMMRGDAARISEISLAELRGLVESRNAVIVDARPRVFWRLGHLPGAVSVPHNDFDRGFAQLRRSLAATHDPRPVVVYCEGGACHDGRTVAAALMARGLTDVRLFPSGWSAWEAARLPSDHGER